MEKLLLFVSLFMRFYVLNIKSFVTEDFGQVRRKFSRGAECPASGMQCEKMNRETGPNLEMRSGIQCQ